MFEKLDLLIVSSCAIFYDKSLISLLSCCSFTTEKNGDGYDEKSRTVLNVALAAFTLSIKANLKLQVLLVIMKCYRFYYIIFSH